MSTTEDFDIDCTKLRNQFLEKKQVQQEKLEEELRDIILKLLREDCTLQEGKDLYRKWNEKRVGTRINV